ncbi:MAG: hypothetical protein Q8M09_15425 [Pseudomonadota bacterium]|nr:hypothetical protein [Pseudomonadota bacterium]MDP1905615.1 hypothetical protein [Pseudomonadota bacterium]
MSAGIEWLYAGQQKSKTTQARKPGEMKEEQRAKRRKGATQFVMVSALALTKKIGR